MILEGRTLSQSIREPLAQRAEAVRQKLGRAIHLCAISSTEDYGAYTYLNKEVAAAEKLGVETKIFKVDNQTPANSFVDLVKRLSQDPQTDAILIPRPLPVHLASTEYASYLAPQKDIDGMSALNAGHLFLCKTWEEIEKLTGYVPCTAMAVMKLLKYHHIDVTGKTVSVIGRSSTVGRPLAHLLTCQNSTVTLCHTHTNLPRALKDADLVCTAAGSPGLLQTSWLKQGACVIDISTNWHQNQLQGDAFPQELEARGFSYSPVPGGVGPVTLAVLLENIILCGERKQP